MSRAEQIVKEELAASKLTLEDLRGRIAGEAELTATKAPISQIGYVIPYFDILGKPLPFYRVKLHDFNPKYKQPKNTPSHLYYPPNFMKVFNAHKKQVTEKANGISSPCIIVTEGEKKAALACNLGIPAVAVGGVYSWRSRTLILPSDAKIKVNEEKNYLVKLPGSVDVGEFSASAVGLDALVDLVQSSGATLLIIFDTDAIPNLDVQKAAALLGYEFRVRAVSATQIRQIKLPLDDDGFGKKIGLDDYLVKHGKEGLTELIHQNLLLRSAFPRHPAPKTYINRKLDAGTNTRRDIQELAFAVIAELDARGRRLKSIVDNVPYYFDEHSLKLMPANMVGRDGEFVNDAFTVFLYQEFGISISDRRLLTWLASQFSGEEPVESVEPCRVVTIPKNLPNCIAVQLSDSHYALVKPAALYSTTANPEDAIEICTNGQHGVLFVQDQVNPVDLDKLKAELAKHLQNAEANNGVITPHWAETLSTVNLASQGQKDIATLLYYFSPWLNRWRGTQLPVEIACGESGSGKSSLFTLRLKIMTGRPTLRNIPADLRDFYASISSGGGMIVVDNVAFTNKDIRQRLSDELCRLTTEPDPHFELRKLYTTSQQIRMPVRATFAFTAIRQPFHNQDLIQRAVVLDFTERQSTPDDTWVPNQLARLGGREGWLAHHLTVLHFFMRKAADQTYWNGIESSTSRLTNFERCLRLMSRTLGLDESWIPSQLKSRLVQSLVEADWALEGLQTYVRYMRSQYAHAKKAQITSTATEIAEWAQNDEMYADNSELCNARRVGRYLQDHRGVIAKLIGLEEYGKKGNRVQYRVLTEQEQEDL